MNLNANWQPEERAESHSAEPAGAEPMGVGTRLRNTTGGGSLDGKLRRVASLAVVAVGLAFLPAFVSTYTVTTATEILAFGVLCLSLHLLMGWTGILSLGQAAYFGVGAYAAGLLAVHYTSSSYLMLVFGLGAGAAAAALTGWMLVRSRAGYLIMITIAIGELLANASDAMWRITNGDDGLWGIPYTEVFGITLRRPTAVYRYVLVLTAVALVVMYFLGRSPFGQALRGIRENEARMRSLGYSTYLYKYASFCIAGGIAGLAGSIWITHARFVSPHDMTIGPSAHVLIAVAVGGTKRLWGPFLGATLIIVADNMLPGFLEGHGPLVLGVILVLVVYVLPTGMTGVPARVSRLLGRNS